MEIKDKQRFVSKFDIDNPKDCWLWKGTIGKHGYGVFKLKSKMVRAHRLSYQEFSGEIPERLLVCHKCDNPICVNPNHMFLGTYQDNVDDCISKGRFASGDKHSSRTRIECRPKGEKHANHKLTKEESMFIKKDNGATSDNKLAKRFGVSRACIWRVRTGKNWKWL